MLEVVASVGCIQAVLPADKVVAEYLLLTVILVSADQIQRAESDLSASPADSAFSLCISCKCACDGCNILLKSRTQLGFLVRTCQAELWFSCCCQGWCTAFKITQKLYCIRTTGRCRRRSECCVSMCRVTF